MFPKEIFFIFGLLGSRVSKKEIRPEKGALLFQFLIAVFPESTEKKE
jgi:hypothetical protein